MKKPCGTCGHLKGQHKGSICFECVVDPVHFWSPKSWSPKPKLGHSLKAADKYGHNSVSPPKNSKIIPPAKRVRPQLWVQVQEQPGSGQVRVFFRLLGERLPNGAVPLSWESLGKGCITPISQLWNHDGHAMMLSKNEDVEKYIHVVKTEVEGVLNGDDSWKYPTAYRLVPLNLKGDFDG